MLSVLTHSKRALSAYELIDLCQKELDETISAMTMYRTLDFLQQEKLIHKLDLANKYIACSHIVCDHSHDEVPLFLICNQCNSVQETAIKQNMMAILNQAVQAARYQLVSSQLELFCICESCSQK